MDSEREKRFLEFIHSLGLSFDDVIDYVDGKFDEVVERNLISLINRNNSIP